MCILEFSRQRSRQYLHPTTPRPTTTIYLWEPWTMTCMRSYHHAIRCDCPEGRIQPAKILEWNVLGIMLSSTLIQWASCKASRVLMSQSWKPKYIIPIITMADESTCGEGNGFIIIKNCRSCSFCFRRPIIEKMSTITEQRTRALSWL